VPATFSGYTDFWGMDTILCFCEGWSELDFLAFPIELLAFRLPLSFKCEWLGLVKYLHEGK
jgi:hypothetical protein